ncbi:LOW QUALITY PROTEIN: hypothetical protein U9M48_005021 [Paspalum notatum var. saurae]|uniref:R13L1/DRL21-like LRR repeat region domain-containing protein n=1 Tax=Paspalum notatum var. saurae TaxID=547442 RepID=A0AAQ3SJJ3_PASNO
MGPYFKDDGGSSSMISSDDDLVRLTTMVKDVATHHFQSDTTIFSSFDEMYAAFCSTVGDVRVFYEHGSSYNDDTIKLDMLRDGCFLLQYMDMCTTTSRDKMPPSLVCYFESNQVMIDRDIMLLENQLPWVVIETLRSYRKIEQSVAVEGFVEKMARTLQVRKGKDDVPFALDGTYTPPHLLGLLWFYKTRRSHQQTASDDDSQQNERSFSLMVNSCCYMSTCGLPLLSDDDHARITTVSKTTSAIELAEIGIKITASKTTNFTDMGINKGLFCTEISLPPLLLDETRLSWLVNMAAFELCIAGTLGDGDQKHAICSYLFVLAMLMDREDDVHRLRSKGLVQGELSNKEMLHFFKLIVKHISGGPRYMDLMGEIEEYKLKRWMWIKVHKFIYKNYKTIAAVLSIIGVLVGIFKELFSLKRLGPLSQLMRLDILGLKNVPSASFAIKARLAEKVHLFYLALQCNNRQGDDHQLIKGEGQQQMEKVFDELCPPSCIEDLRTLGALSHEECWTWVVTTYSVVENFGPGLQIEMVTCPALERISNVPKLQELRTISCSMLKVLEGFPALQRVWLEDYNMGTLPEYLQDVNPRHLDIDCDVSLLTSIAKEKSSPEWDKFSHIKQVRAYEDDKDNKIERKWYVKYTRDPFSFRTNISASADASGGLAGHMDRRNHGAGVALSPYLKQQKWRLLLHVILRRPKRPHTHPRSAAGHAGVHHEPQYPGGVIPGVGGAATSASYTPTSSATLPTPSSTTRWFIPNECVANAGATAATRTSPGADPSAAVSPSSPVRTGNANRTAVASPYPTSAITLLLKIVVCSSPREMTWSPEE